MLNYTQTASATIDDLPLGSDSDSSMKMVFKPKTAPTVKPIVMIVDDEERNIKLLSALLARENYQICSCHNGKDALARVEKSAPDLILLDIMMPGIDGIQVCRQLKQNEKTQAIPVVMVTALRDEKCRLAAVEAGADDFLNKPVSPEELRIRVKSLLRLKSYHDRLSTKLEEIEEKNNQLQELERTKEGLIHMIIHDLNNPLSAISSTLELMAMCDSTLSEEGKDRLKTSLRNCTHLEFLIRGLLDIHRLEDGQLPLNIQATDIARFIQATLDPLQALVTQNETRLDIQFPSLLPLIAMDHQLIQRVLANLVRNALHHTPSGGELFLSIDYQPDQKFINVSVRDTGDGIDQRDQKEIFNKFQQGTSGKSKANLNRHGLGLAFCKLAVEAHGGQISVKSEGKGKGTEFNFTLPIHQQSENT